MLPPDTKLSSSLDSSVDSALLDVDGWGGFGADAGFGADVVFGADAGLGADVVFGADAGFVAAGDAELLLGILMQAAFTSAKSLAFVMRWVRARCWPSRVMMAPQD